MGHPPTPGDVLLSNPLVQDVSKRPNNPNLTNLNNYDNTTHYNNLLTRRTKKKEKKKKKPPSLKKLLIYATNSLKEPIPGSLRRRRKKWLQLSAPISALVWRVHPSL